MKLLCLYYTHKPGGFCSRLYKLLNACTQAGWEVHYATLDPAPPQLSSKVQVHLIPFPLRARRGLVFWLTFVIWAPIYAAALALRLKPKHYVAFGAFYSSVYVLARLFHRAPLTLFLRSLVFRINEVNQVNKLLQIFSNAIDRVGIACASAVVCMTEAMRSDLEEFLGYRLHNVQILPNNIPTVALENESTVKLRELAKLPADALLVLTAGVLDKRKNAACAIEAFEIIKQQHPNKQIHLFIAGDGPLLAEHRAAVAAKNLQNISFLGWQNNLGKIFGQMDLLIHPSRHEGMSNTILEALAAGLPVIAASSAESLELLVDDRLLFKAENPKALAEILSSLDHSRLNELRLLCSTVVSRYSFDWDSRAREILQGRAPNK